MASAFAGMGLGSGRKAKPAADAAGLLSILPRFRQSPGPLRDVAYPNDFAAFSPDNPPFEDKPGIFATTGSYGYCDVVLYHPNHNLLPSAMSAEHWAKVVETWRARTEQVMADPAIAYVHIFENA